MKINENFLNKIEKQIGEEGVKEYLRSFNNKKVNSLRVNTLKISVEEFKRISPFELEEIPWEETGFYYSESDKPSKHPYYHAGLYYIQEASAMSVVNELNPKKDDIILDLCSAPGGKTVQIANRLCETGLIVSNDISTGRLKALIKNIELAGIKNIYVINENHYKITEKFKNVFDKILVDAPCSGEGMFRKDEKILKSWSIDEVKKYSKMQDDIMNVIDESLKKDGEIVYSTCTFSKEENEDTINKFLEKNKSFKFVDAKDYDGFVTSGGFIRLWPFNLKGEGHFISHIKNFEGKDDSVVSSYSTNDADKNYEKYKVKKKQDRFNKLDNNRSKNYNNDFLDIVNKFLDENLNFRIEGKLSNINNKIYVIPNIDINLSGIRVLRSGWLIGEIKRDRFIPSQAMAMGLKMSDAKRTINLKSDSIEVIKYLKCETINVNGENGLNLICVDNYPIGWGKLNNGTLKNMYPPSWRMQ